MKEKIKRYRLPLSKFFPKYHIKNGLPTNFEYLIWEGKITREEINPNSSIPIRKIHTCRVNYEYWKKRIDKVNAGLAVLEVYVWVGKPYRKGSTTRVLFTFDKDNGIGVEQISIYKTRNEYDCDIVLGRGYTYEIEINTLAANDGLSVEDFIDWFAPKFKNSDVFEGVIIHFTDFRY